MPNRGSNHNRVMCPHQESNPQHFWWTGWCSKQRDNLAGASASILRCSLYKKRIWGGNRGALYGHEIKPIWLLACPHFPDRWIMWLAGGNCLYNTPICPRMSQRSEVWKCEPCFSWLIRSSRCNFRAGTLNSQQRCHLGPWDKCKCRPLPRSAELETLNGAQRPVC